MNLHPLYATGILLVGWLGFALRKSSIGGIIAGLLIFEGLLAVSGMAVFLDHKREPETTSGPVLLWVFFFGAALFLILMTALSLRQYFAHRSVRWKENEEIRN